MLERGSENVQQLLTEAEGRVGVWVWGWVWVCVCVGVGSVWGYVSVCVGVWVWVCVSVGGGGGNLRNTVVYMYTVLFQGFATYICLFESCDKPI